MDIIIINTALSRLGLESARRQSTNRGTHIRAHTPINTDATGSTWKHLRMISTRMGDNVAALRRGEQHSVARPTRLERPCLLEEFALEEHLASSAHHVEGAACHHGRAVDMRSDACCCLSYSLYRHYVGLRGGVMSTSFHLVRKFRAWFR